jgi:hypothetical protein
MSSILSTASSYAACNDDASPTGTLQKIASF